MTEYTKQRVTMQYSEVVYYADGVEIGRDELNDAHSYDADPREPMTEEEIEDWA